MVYLLPKKSQAFEIFKQFKKKVEAKTGKVVKALRTDRGGEDLYDEFKTFFLEHGIKRQHTTSYSPQQNGVAERRNTIFINMVVSMIAAKKNAKEILGRGNSMEFLCLKQVSH